MEAAIAQKFSRPVQGPGVGMPAGDCKGQASKTVGPSSTSLPQSIDLSTAQSTAASSASAALNAQAEADAANATKKNPKPWVEDVEDWESEGTTRTEADLYLMNKCPACFGLASWGIPLKEYVFHSLEIVSKPSCSRR